MEVIIPDIGCITQIGQVEEEDGHVNGGPFALEVVRSHMELHGNLHKAAMQHGRGNLVNALSNFEYRL